MLVSRLSAVERFGLWSTAEYTVSPSRAKVHGTRWGEPSALIVASRAMLAAATRSRARSEIEGAPDDTGPPDRLGLGAEEDLARSHGDLRRDLGRGCRERVGRDDR